LETKGELRESVVTRAVSVVALRLGAGNGGRRGAILSQVVEKRREVERFIKFGLVGVLGTVIDMGILNLLILLLGVPKFWANTCSFTAAALSNFTWNRLWTFPESRQRPLGRQLGQFFAVSLGGYAINQILFLSLSAWVFGGWGTLGYNVAKFIAIIVVLFWNFTINRIWTYRGL
jgi:putative flippase GtrA